MKRLWRLRGHAQYLAETLRAVAHPVRLGVVAVLCERQANVTEIAELVGRPQAVVSQALRILRMSGLVRVARAGGFARYSLAEPRLRDLVKCLEGCPSSRSERVFVRRRGGRA